MIEWIIETIALIISFIILGAGLLLFSILFPEEEDWSRKNQ